VQLLLPRCHDRRGRCQKAPVKRSAPRPRFTAAACVWACRAVVFFPAANDGGRGRGSEDGRRRQQLPAGGHDASRLRLSSVGNGMHARPVPAVPRRAPSPACVRRRPLPGLRRARQRLSARSRSRAQARAIDRPIRSTIQAVKFELRSVMTHMSVNNIQP
jgi:hypothetical protein